jgi:hypothetical protein
MQEPAVWSIQRWHDTEDGGTRDGAARGGAEDAAAPSAKHKNGGVELTRGQGRIVPMGRRRRQEAESGRRV